MATEMRQRTPWGSNGNGASKLANGDAPLKPGVPTKADLEKYYLVAVRVLEAVGPYYAQVRGWIETAWAAAAPYHPRDLATAAYGLVLVFFGGVFMTLVASVEAASIFGWPKIQRSVTALAREWKVASEAFERDNQRDDDGDGVRDVDALTPQQLAARRLAVLTKTVDPEQLAAAVEGLTAAWVAILATLRVRFAKAITFGTALGNVLVRVIGTPLTKTLEAVVPDEYDRWVPVLVRYGLRYAGVSVAWFMLRITTSAYSSLRGSQLFLVGLIGYLVKHGHLRAGLFSEGNPAVIAAWAVLAAFGWWSQVSRGFSLIFPINMLLLPFSVLEQLLIFAVGVDEK